MHACTYPVRLATETGLGIAGSKTLQLYNDQPHDLPCVNRPSVGNPFQFSSAFIGSFHRQLAKHEVIIMLGIQNSKEHAAHLAAHATQ